MGRVLSATDVARYWDQGYLAPVRVMDEAAATAHHARLDSYIAAKAGGADEEALHHKLLRFKPHLISTWLNDLVRTPAILDCIEDLIGPDILVWSSAFFIKRERDPGFITYHQDSITYQLDGDELVSAWLALSPSVVANGCVRVLPKSHALGELPHHDTWAENNRLSRGEVVDYAVDETKVADLVLRPGEMSLHHIRLIHGSNPNPTGTARIGYAIRYLSPRCRARGATESAMLVRGQDTLGHFEHEPSPSADFAPLAIAAYDRAMAIRTARTFAGTDSDRKVKEGEFAGATRT